MNAFSPHGALAIPTLPITERVKEAEARRVEKERCGALRARIIEQLSATDSFTADLLSIITAIALAELRRANEYGEEFIDWLNAFGIETPEEYDDEQELEKACAIIVGWPLGKVLAFIAWRAVAHEVDDYRYVFNRSLPTPALDAMARAIGLDIAEPLTPTTAAQASEPLRDEKQADAHESWPFPKRENETTQPPIETNEKPKGRGKAKAKAAA